MTKQDLKTVSLFLFDMDGTLYIGDRLFAFTEDLLTNIRRANKRYLFITNNSSRSVDAYVEKLTRLGIHATADDFLTSSQATAFYLKQHYPAATLYVCGTQSLKNELQQEGFSVTEELDQVDCIVMGFDTELTFQKLEDVCRLLSDRDLPYIATNPDVVCPTEFGSVPDCGSVCDMIYNATGKKPFVIGKPSPLMIQLAMEKCRVNPQETAVVGDRIYTDIMSGINAGAVTVLVMSGETTPDMLESSPNKPNFVMQHAGELLAFL